MKKHTIGNLLCFRCPPNCDIVIYDESHSDKIVKYILNERDYFIYHTHPEIFFICPLIIYNMFKKLSFFKISEIKKRNDKIRAFFSQLLFCYRFATLNVILSPKQIVVSF